MDATAPPNPTALSDGQIAPSQQTLLAFACDDATLEVIAEISPGLRRGEDLFEGGISQAIEKVQSGVQPTVLIVDVSTSDSPIAPMSALLAAVGSSCTIVALGTKNDIALYRSLTSIGVTEYLVKPVDAQDLRRSLLVVEHTETRGAPQPVGRLIPITGVRGGVGGSAIALAVAQHLAKGGRHQVALVDLDIYFGTLALTLDIEPGTGLRNALEHPDRIDSLFVASALVNVTESLFVLSGEEPLDSMIYVQPTAIVSLLEELRRIFDLVVVDLPRHLLPYSETIHAGADMSALVTDLSLAGLRDTIRVRETVSKAMPGLKPLIVANRTGLAKHTEITTDAFEKTLGSPLDAAFTEDAKAANEVIHNREFDPKPAKIKVAPTMDALARRLGGQEIQTKKESQGWLQRKVGEAAKLPLLSRTG